MERFLVALKATSGTFRAGPPRRLHLGVMAGTLDLVQRAFLGTQIRGDVLWFNPMSPTGSTGSAW